MLAVLGAGEYRGEIDIIFIWSPEALPVVCRVGWAAVGGSDAFREHGVACVLFIGGADRGREGLSMQGNARRPPARELVARFGLTMEESRGKASQVLGQ